MERKQPVDLLPPGMVNIGAACIQALSSPLITHKHLAIDALRLDKIDPIISGNKWFKLKYYITSALDQQSNTLITFGGAWSNHLVATAAAAKKVGLKSIGFVRGEEPGGLSITLQTARAYGMDLQFLTRGDYASKNETSFITALQQRFPDGLIIPEGGAGENGVRGAADIAKLVPPDKHYDYVCCAVGTGTMLQGLASGFQNGENITGIPVLKGFDDWQPLVENDAAHRVKIICEYNLGGYAKSTPALIAFMNAFYQENAVPTDFVYTGKLFFSIYDLIKKDYFPTGSRVLVIHSGGLQGNASLKPGTLVF